MTGPAYTSYVSTQKFQNLYLRFNSAMSLNSYYNLYIFTLEIFTCFLGFDGSLMHMFCGWTLNIIMYNGDVFIVMGYKCIILV